MKMVAVMNPKGGLGKTTATINYYFGCCNGKDLIIIPRDTKPFKLFRCWIGCHLLISTGIQPTGWSSLLNNTQSLTLKILKDRITHTDIRSLKTAIEQRQSYVKSMLEGKTTNGAAKGEILILTREL